MVKKSSILICKHTTLEDLEETDACILHPNKGFGIEIHAYSIIKHSVIKLTTSQILKIAIRFSTNFYCATEMISSSPTNLSVKFTVYMVFSPRCSSYWCSREHNS